MRILCLVLLFLCLGLQPAFSGEEETERFRVAANGTIVDNKTGLIWAAKDNGAEINWHEALTYSEKFDAGDGKTWRMPYQNELETLYDSEAKDENGYAITNLIKLSACCIWAYDDSVNAAGIFSFKTGKQPWGFKKDTGSLRALPVRTRAM